MSGSRTEISYVQIYFNMITNNNNIIEILHSLEEKYIFLIKLKFDVVTIWTISHYNMFFSCSYKYTVQDVLPVRDL